MKKYYKNISSLNNNYNIKNTSDETNINKNTSDETNINKITTDETSIDKKMTKKKKNNKTTEESSIDKKTTDETSIEKKTTDETSIEKKMTKNKKNNKTSEESSIEKKTIKKEKNNKTREESIDKKTREESSIDKKVKKRVELICYCIINEERSRTYIGATKNFSRRIRQHNRELVGGAKSTKGYHWSAIILVSGFKSWKDTLSFEWHFKHKKTKTKWGIGRRIESINKLMNDERWQNLEIKIEDSIYNKLEYNKKDYLRMEDKII